MAPGQRRPVLDGFVAGALGYASVVVVFALVNLASGRWLFHTPELLGRSLLGVEGSGPGAVLAPVLAFNGVHLLVSLALGLAFSWLVERAESDHALGFGLVFGILALGGFIPIFFGALTVELVHALTWSDVILGSLVGGVATLGYLGWIHRGLVRALFREAEV